MLTVIVGRSVLGVPISAAEAWRRARRRVPALIGLKLLVLTANGTIVAVPVLVMMVLNYLVGWITATLIGMPLALIGFAGLTSLDIVLSFAPAAIVLERRNIPNAVRRSAGLVKGRFWRTLGIRLMAGIVGAAVAAAISVPLRIAFHVVLEFGAAAGAPAVGGAISEAIGQIIIVPFLAGVTTLLYFDARIRSEAFDFVLRTPRPLDADSVWL